jgi:hypothetical protein
MAQEIPNDFKYVRRKGKRKNKEPKDWKEFRLTEIRRYYEHLKSGYGDDVIALFEENVPALANYSILYCGALGNLTGNHRSRYQFALCLHLRDFFGWELFFFDPCFEEEDEILLEHFSCRIAEPFQPDRVVYFYPHAPADAVYRAFSSGSVVVTNDYLGMKTETVSDGTHSTSSKHSAVAVQKRIESFSHVRLPVFKYPDNSTTEDDVFNDTVLYWK